MLDSIRIETAGHMRALLDSGIALPKELGPLVEKELGPLVEKELGH